MISKVLRVTNEQFVKFIWDWLLECV